MRALKFLPAAILITAVAAAGFVYLAPEKFTSLIINVDRRSAGLVRKEIDLHGGLHYVYLEGKGEPLVLLHGFGGMKDNFTRAARLLTPHFRVIIPDEIGFAESSHPQDADYSSRGQAGNVHALVQALGIDRLHLGGNSMGGQIALAYAAQYPSEVGSLWLLDAAGIWSGPKSELAEIVEAGGRIPYFIASESDYSQMIRFVMSKPPYIPQPMLKVLAQDSIRNLELQKRIFKTIREESVEKRITGMTIPTLIVWGEKDRVFHVGTAEVLHKLLPNSQVIVMPGVGHVPMMEQPRQSAEDYLQFRNSLAAVSGRGGSPSAQ